MSEKIPIGDLIVQKLKDNDRNISWLAQKVSCDRSNLYKRLINNNIEIDLLFRISEILQEDFFACYSEMLSGKIYHKNG